MKPTDVMYALAKRIGDLERRVETLEKQAMFNAKPQEEAPKPRRGRPPKAVQ